MKAIVTFETIEEFDAARKQSDLASVASYPFYGQNRKEWEKPILVIVGNPTQVQHVIRYYRWDEKYIVKIEKGY